jgi:hypothetical protein
VFSKKPIRSLGSSRSRGNAEQKVSWSKPINQKHTRGKTRLDDETRRRRHSVVAGRRGGERNRAGAT